MKGFRGSILSINLKLDMLISNFIVVIYKILF